MALSRSFRERKWGFFLCVLVIEHQFNLEVGLLDKGVLKIWGV